MFEISLFRYKLLNCKMPVKMFSDEYSGLFWEGRTSVKFLRSVCYSLFFNNNIGKY